MAMTMGLSFIVKFRLCTVKIDVKWSETVVDIH